MINTPKKNTIIKCKYCNRFHMMSLEDLLLYEMLKCKCGKYLQLPKSHTNENEKKNELERRLEKQEHILRNYFH